MSTTPSDPDFIELPPDQYSVEELREVLFGGSDRLPKVFALSLLRQKDYPDKVPDLERVATDEKETPGIRRHAIIELGRIGSPDAVASLEKAARTSKPFVRTGALETLAGALSQSTPAGPQEATWPGVLVRFRVRDPSTRLPVPPEGQLLPIDAQAATQISIEPIGPEELDRALTEVERTVGMQMSKEGAIGFRAARHSYIFVPSEGRPLSSVGELTRLPAVVGSVAVRYTEEHDHWEVAYHVLTQPSAQGGAKLDILVTRANGELVYVGFATVDVGKARFQVDAVSAPGASPIAAVGTLDSAGIHLESVRVSPVTNRTVTPRPRFTQRGGAEKGETPRA